MISLSPRTFLSGRETFSAGYVLSIPKIIGRDWNPSGYRYDYTDKDDSITEVIEQSGRALEGIKLINSFVPVIFIIIAIIIIMLYPLSTSKMKEIESELKSRKEKE